MKYFDSEGIMLSEERENPGGRRGFWLVFNEGTSGTLALAGVRVLVIYFLKQKTPKFGTSESWN